LKTWWDGVLASTPLASLAAGLGLGGAGYVVQRPGVAASGAVVCAAGLYIERLQARSLRRRRRAERLRARHEVTELRRTIAQLREDVDAFQRALLDTEAVLAARSIPVPPPLAAATRMAQAKSTVAAPAAPSAAGPVAPPVAPSVAMPFAVPAQPAAPAPASGFAPSPADAEAVVVVPLADVEVAAWVQTRERRPLAQPSLPFQQPSPFVPAATGAAATSMAATGAAPTAEDLEVLEDADEDEEPELVVAAPDQGRHVA
jgi:hypothetical protein